eukprot:m.45515 g.45515  ORF g.45515 m.45515 type:complete len:87 (-) comp47257_c0_seq2:88-348(-)
MTKQRQNTGLLSLLLTFAAAMALLPCAAYFSLTWIASSLVLDGQGAGIVGALGAVVVAHLVVGYYIYTAYNLPPSTVDPDEPDKAD